MDKEAVGTEEMEAGMYPSKAKVFAYIAAIAVTMLMLFNSIALVEWTRQPRAGSIIASLQAPAADLHRWMVSLGTATLFEESSDLPCFIGPVLT